MIKNTGIIIIKKKEKKFKNKILHFLLKKNLKKKILIFLKLELAMAEMLSIFLNFITLS